MQPIPAGYPIAELSGPIIVACLLNWGLFGTLSMQLYLYYLAFPDDRRLLKYLVYGIYTIEFVQTMIVAYDTFTVFGYGFGDIEVLTRMNHSWLTVPIMSAVAAGIGQVFYAYRIFILSKSRIIPIFVICISLTSSVAAVITGVYAFQAGNVIKLNNRKTSIALGIWCGASALCDILIAICMTCYASSFSILLMRDSNTRFRRTRTLITKLIRLTIETGSVTAVVALLNVILFLVFRHQTFYMTPALLMPKLYTNTVYMVLNSRIRIIGGRDTYISPTDMSITTTMIRDVAPQSGDGMQGRAPVVTISKEVFHNNYEMGQINDKPQDGCCMNLPA
ncbi:hypothetical protein ARMSODRAFT_1021493 [Armillaria solidipes]|uniref:DUF6534 domain-containing protein n=1 Tax=Armillaria solidipes TaxID=1076256 RepID=A0A2H3BGX6_9AGAR|nr:hypothetical protein ARMSODRAFT_1021493 [Armillaria solidipes]